MPEFKTFDKLEGYSESFSPFKTNNDGQIYFDTIGVYQGFNPTDYQDLYERIHSESDKVDQGQYQGEDDERFSGVFILPQLLTKNQTSSDVHFVPSYQVSKLLDDNYQSCGDYSKLSDEFSSSPFQNQHIRAYVLPDALEVMTTYANNGILSNNLTKNSDGDDESVDQSQDKDQMETFQQQITQNDQQDRQNYHQEVPASSCFNWCFIKLKRIFTKQPYDPSVSNSSNQVTADLFFPKQ